MLAICKSGFTIVKPAGTSMSLAVMLPGPLKLIFNVGHSSIVLPFSSSSERTFKSPLITKRFKFKMMLITSS